MALTPALAVALARCEEVVDPAAEFREKAVAGQSFVTTVLEEPKVFLIGGEGELGRLAAQRLADAA